MSFLKASFFKNLFCKLQKKEEPQSEPEVEPEVEEPKEKVWAKEELLKPITHTRLLTIYCIADLEDGDVPIYTSSGTFIANISEKSRKRLDMEGTGTLPDGRVVNVSTYGSNGWAYFVMSDESPYGVGIKGKALEPWVSLAHNLEQLNTHHLFDREVIVPDLKGYETLDGKTLSGKFRVHDTGGGLRSCPYYKGLWRSGSTKSEHGQFDVFIGGPESIYKKMLGIWNSYHDVFVMPRDLTSVAGKQEVMNLLMDAGLSVDGVSGPKTLAAIKELQNKAGLEQTGEWGEELERFVKLSLENWE